MRPAGYKFRLRVHASQTDAGGNIGAYIWGGTASYPHYIFIAIVETICLLLIIGFAWMWRNVEA